MLITARTKSNAFLVGFPDSEALQGMDFVPCGASLVATHHETTTDQTNAIVAGMESTGVGEGEKNR